MLEVCFNEANGLKMKKKLLHFGQSGKNVMSVYEDTGTQEVRIE